MNEQLNWKFLVQVRGGPTLPASGNQVGDVYSQSQGVVPAMWNGTRGEVELSLPYVDPDDPTFRLQYAGTVGKLAGPPVMMGEDAMLLLGDPVESLSFTDPMASEIR